LTDNATQNWDRKISQYSEKRSNPYVLQKIIQLYNPRYYSDTLLTSLKRTAIEFRDIDMRDEFTLNDMVLKTYQTEEQYITDLSRIMRYIQATRLVFLFKQYNALKGVNRIVYKSGDGMKEALKNVKLDNIKGGLDGLKCYEKYNGLFSRDGIKFYSTDPKIFSFWQGWKYELVEQVDMNEIEGWLLMVKEVIANSDERLYNYLLDWAANMLQHPGRKNKTTLVLKGLQGIGKGRFTDILAELTAGYSNGNINKWDDITGNFNTMLDGNVFIVMNEARDTEEVKRADFDVFKSLVTEEDVVVNEKNVPKVQSQNVVNFCIASNNEFPIAVEKGDRRYVVCDCSPKYRGNLSYWKSLCANIETDDHKPIKKFYDNLFTFFMRRDISKFEPSIIPMTTGKTKLIKRTCGGVDRVILEH
jgi:hypothetical protein